MPPFADLYFQLKSHADLFEAEAQEEAEAEEAKMNVWSSVIALVGITVVTAFCADYLVESIDEFSSKLGIPKTFIGIILLPIVGNAAEHVVGLRTPSSTCGSPMLICATPAERRLDGDEGQDGDYAR